MKPRGTAVFCVLPYVRQNEVALKIGKLAVFDKSRQVRFKACALLAYSLRTDIIETLQNARLKVAAAERLDFDAAIDAVQRGNHHFFYDRNHTGRIKWDLAEEPKDPELSKIPNGVR